MEHNQIETDKSQEIKKQSVQKQNRFHTLLWKIALASPLLILIIAIIAAIVVSFQAQQLGPGVAPAVHVPKKLHAGQELVVKCKAKGDLANDYNAHKGIRYEFFVNDDFAGTSKETEDELKIKKASKEDHEGSWSCQTFVPKTGVISERSPAKVLTIIGVPLQPTITLNKTVAKDGEKVSFSCKSDQDSDAATGYSFFLNGSLHLIVEQPSVTHSVIQEAHEGTWSCGAHNKAGKSPSSKAVRLQIKVGPCNCRRICSQAKSAWEDFKPTLQIIAGAATVAGLVLAFPYALGAIGFGAGGIGAGTIAANLMAMLGTGGMIIPALQSMGAAGVAWTTIFTMTTAGALFVALYKKMESCGCQCEF